jgi:eukaryotic translation initiation factor 2-alpha kinase 4
LPTLAVDVPIPALEAMARSAAWIQYDNPEAWKSVLANFTAQQTEYAHQIKDAVQKKWEEGCRYLLLMAVRGERVCLLDLW